MERNKKKKFTDALVESPRACLLGSGTPGLCCIKAWGSRRGFVQYFSVMYLVLYKNVILRVRHVLNIFDCMSLQSLFVPPPGSGGRAAGRQQQGVVAACLWLDPPCLARGLGRAGVQLLWEQGEKGNFFWGRGDPSRCSGQGKGARWECGVLLM